MRHEETKRFASSSFVPSLSHHPLLEWGGGEILNYHSTKQMADYLRRTEIFSHCYYAAITRSDCHVVGTVATQVFDTPIFLFGGISIEISSIFSHQAI